MRITGLATGLDMDEIIKNSMKPYRIKIEKKGQDKEILEIKQKLYREVIKDSRELYNKYFDVTKSDSLLLSKNWSSVKFKSSDENVLTVTGSGDAKAENYTITGNIAKAAKATLKLSVIQDNKVVVNGKEFILKGDNEKEKANDLSNQLKTAGINVSVRYSEFAGDVNENAKGFIFESTLLGRDNTFVIGGTPKLITDDQKGYTSATAAELGKVSTATFNLDSINTLTLDGIADPILINGSDLKNPDGSLSEDELNKNLRKYNIEVSIEEGNVTFKSTKLGEITNPNLVVNDKNISKSEADDTVDLFKNGDNEIKASNIIELIGSEKISVNGKAIDLSLKKTDEDITSYLNRALKSQGLNIAATLEADGRFKLTSKEVGEKAIVDLILLEGTTEAITNGEDGEIVFTDTKGGAYSYKGTSNTVVVDGMTFKFTGEIPNGGISVNGKQDVTEIKEKLVKFINDYNTLTEKLNKLTTDKRNRNFSPLTADQKKEMSEDEIKLWNEKVEKGQLSRDTDLSRISNSLKQAMRSLVDGTGLNLEKIGIAPVADYQGTKNGTYTVDETKLAIALEENSEQIMNMFIKSVPKDDTLSEGQKYSKTGIMNRIKDVLYKETVTVTSSLLKKSGIEGSSTAYTNEITKSIEKYEQKMADMEKDFSRREQALYTKYANLESIMNKYNSQQSYLSQQLGLS